MIRQFLLGAAAMAAPLAVVAVAAPAMAQTQDLPWNSGWYVGANIGMNWADNALNTHAYAPASGTVISAADLGLINAGSGGSNKTGFTGGIEGGYNWRTDNWLFGIETDYDALDTSQSATNHATSTGPVVNPPGVPITYTLTQHATTNWMWTLRPRIGWVYDRWLFYATGGMAMTDIKLNVTLSDNRSSGDSVSMSDNATRTGWIAGGGAGYAFNPNWTVKAEWLYADFGSTSITRVAPSGYVGLTSKTDVRSNILRVGFDYKF